MYDILDIIRNIDNLYENNTSLGILKDVERVIEQLDIYAYENWENGELAYGPQVDRHWITAGFMWPANEMPNPIAAKRLQDIGCKIKYQRSHLVEPRKIRTQEDIRPGTKKGKLDRKPIWIVEIQMPKKVAFDMYRGYMDKMKAETEPDKSAKEKQGMPPVAMPGAGAMPGVGAMPPVGAMPAAPTAGAAPAMPGAPV